MEIDHYITLIHMLTDLSSSLRKGCSLFCGGVVTVWRLTLPLSRHSVVCSGALGKRELTLRLLTIPVPVSKVEHDVWN